MSIPSSSRSIVFGGAWLATAVIAYSIGSMGGSTKPVASPTPATGGAAPGSPAAAAALAASIYAPHSTDAAGGAAPTTAKVTGGMPMEEWLKGLMAQDDEATRAGGFLRLLETLNTAEQIEAALKVVSENGGRNRGPMRVGREFSLLLERYAKLDPKAAAAYASDPKRGNEERWIGTSTVLKTWTRLHPDDAIAWAQENGNPPADANAQQQRGPGGPGGQDGNWAVASVVSQLAKTDVERAMQVAGTQESSRSRGRMMETLISELTAQRGEEAARGAIVNLPAGSFRDGIIAQFAARAANNDGPGTAEWVMALPAGAGKARALSEVIDQWSKDNAPAAAAFLTKLPVSAETDGAREQLAGNVLKSDPPGALAWASSITDPALRDKSTEELLRNWIRRDAPAAQTYIASANLTPEVKAKVTAPAAGGNGGPGGQFRGRGGRGN